MNRYVVARPHHNRTVAETYASALYGEQTPGDVLAHIINHMAFWPSGTVVQWWIVKASDAGAARLLSTAKATIGPCLETIGGDL